MTAAERACEALEEFLSKPREMTEEEFRKNLTIALAPTMYRPEDSAEQNSRRITGHVSAITDRLF